MRKVVSIANKIFFALLIYTGTFAGAGKLPADEPAEQITPQQKVFFESEVLPILKTNCYQCHSHESGKAKGGLVVDSKNGFLTGGESGAAIAPGKPADSLLIQVVLRDPSVAAMPPEEPLAEQEIQILTRWVEMGAPDPRVPTSPIASNEAIWEQSKTHWSFQPITNPPLPSVARPDWIRTPVDNFVLASLDQAQMTPASKADPHSLVRRLYYDMLGLPPTADEVDEFTREYERSPENAVKQCVNRLLDSPHYGERWARHWMDVARYADVSGAQRNRDRDDRLPFASAYRDYLIRSFNNDKPYDQFIREQLVADQMELSDRRDLAATSFVSIGSVAGTEEERIAERIDTVMQVFQGLTVGCARCHDHKFDPIPTEDFYALRGVIASTAELGTGRAPEKVDLLECEIIQECSDPELRQAWQAELAKAEEEFQQYEEKLWLPIEQKWRDLTPTVLAALVSTEEERGGLNPRDYYRNRLPQSLFGGWSELIRKGERRFDPVFEPWIRLSKLSPEQFAEKSKDVLSKLDDGKKKPNALIVENLLARNLASMKDVAAAYSDLLMKLNTNWNAVTPCESEDEEQLRQLLYGTGMPPVRSANKSRDAFGNQGDKERNNLLRKVSNVRYHHPGAPIRAMGLRDSTKIADSRVFVRGEPDQPGDVVTRRYLKILSNVASEPFRNGSGRMDWAMAITHPQNPLTARVMVNRVWMHHFGKPLVDTPNDFGLQVAAPKQLMLLDWLASHFMKSNWSIKELHRVILLSNTWQQSSTEHANYDAMNQLDPENQLLWRQNLKRLEFEPIRDSILAVSGSLDLTMFGRSVDLIKDPSINRRAVYAMIDRTEIPVLLSTFDVPNPNLTSATRFVTTVSPQSLFMMNNELVLESVARLGRSEEFTRLAQPKEKLDWLYRRILQRAPTAEETETLLGFVEQQSAAQALAKAEEEKTLAQESEPEMALIKELESQSEVDQAGNKPSDKQSQRLAQKKAAQIKAAKARLAQKKAQQEKLAKQKAAREKLARGAAGKKVAPPFSEWEQVIHALLMSNEFSYLK